MSQSWSVVAKYDDNDDDNDYNDKDSDNDNDDYPVKLCHLSRFHIFEVFCQKRESFKCPVKSVLKHFNA